jgi:hypothetical protein
MAAGNVKIGRIGLAIHFNAAQGPGIGSDGREDSSDALERSEIHIGKGIVSRNGRVSWALFVQGPNCPVDWMSSTGLRLTSVASKRKGKPGPTSFIRRSLISNSIGALVGCALLMMSLVSVETKRSTIMLILPKPGRKLFISWRSLFGGIHRGAIA